MTPHPLPLLSWRLAVLALTLGLLAGPATAQKDLAPEEIPVFVVPRLAQAPAIDGAIGADEWRGALAVGGVASPGRDLVPRPTTYFLAWDAGHFYLAYRVYLRPGYKPTIRDGRSPGLAGVYDDGAELVVKPMGQNVPVNNQQAAFKFFLNCLGNIGDATKLDLGQQLKNWAPQFTTAARLTPPGSAPDGGRWCEVELSAAPGDFELKGDHRAGDQWRLMLGFNHIPMWMQARVPCVGGYFDASGGGYCRVTLVDDAPAVQLRMETLPNLAMDGTAALVVSAHNPGKTAAALTVAINLADKIVKNEALAVPAGKTAQYALNEKLPDDAKGGKARVVVSAGDRVLLGYTTNFKVGGLDWMMAPVKEANPNTFPVDTRFNPVRGWLLVKADTYYLPDPTAAKSVSYRVLPDGEGAAPLLTGTLTTTAEWYFQERLALPALKPGKYAIEVSMALADGKTLGPMRRSFEKVDEAAVYPEWWGGRYGQVERVLPPFTAMKREDARVSCWGREYTLDAVGLPAALRSREGAVLAEPARVVVVAADGQETAIPLASAPTFTETKDWRVRFTGQAAGGGLDFRAAGWVEQDGLVYVELTYAPTGGTPVRLNGLRLEYPLAAADAECLVCIGPGANFSSKTTMLLPPGKTGRLWSTLDTGRSGAGMTVGTFYPTVWIGNERRGLLWWADSDEGWFPDNDTAAHDAVRAGGAVVLRNHLVGQPVELTAPRTVRFSYIATPFRPFTKGWRMVGATEDGTFVQPFRGIRKDSQTGQMVNPGAQQQNWIHPESRYPEEWSAIWAEQKEKADAHARNFQWRDPYAGRNGVNFTHMSFALHGYGRKSIIKEVYDYFGPEWEGDKDTWNESYIDYAMYLFKGALAEGGVRSTYWDITFPTEFGNLLSGLCYRLPDGRVQKGYNGWNQRRFMMRLQAMMVDHGLFPNAVGSHSTNAYMSIAMPWLDAVLDGERNWNLDVTDLDWVDYYPIERMRTMSSPHAWGTPICWMANLDSGDKEKVNGGKRIQGMWLWMHDSWRNPYVPQLSAMPQPALEWGLNGEDVSYTPYWRDGGVKSADKDVLVSVWRMSGRAVLGVYNYDRKATKDAALTVDLIALGLARDDAQAARALARGLFVPAGATVEFDAAQWALRVLALPPHHLALVGLAAPDPAAVARATKALPAVLAGALPPAVVDFGLAVAATKHHAPGAAPGVECADAAIAIGLWQLPDRVLLLIENRDDKAAKSPTIKVDLDAWGLVPKLPWQEFVRVSDLNKGEKDAPATLDFHARTLALKGLPPQSIRLVALRRY